MTDTADLSDEQLASAVREQDKELYGEIIGRYQSKLSHYLRKFIQNPEELEDVLQEVFIKAYRNLYGFNAKRKFSSWIYRIAHNEAVNHLKRNSRRVFSLDEMEYKAIDEKIDIQGGIDSGLERERIEGGLASLKEKYREPLILYFLEEKSYEEISDILRLPRNTVGVLIMRGKKMLKERLGE